MGDWNQHPGILPQELVLRQQGFVEIQQHMAAMQGREVSFTCKGASVKDFVWISPELIPYLHAVTVDNDLVCRITQCYRHIFVLLAPSRPCHYGANLPHYPGKRSVTTTTRQCSIQSWPKWLTTDHCCGYAWFWTKCPWRSCCLKTRQVFSLFIVVGVLLFHQLCVVSLSLLIRQLGIKKLILPSWENIFNMCSGWNSFVSLQSLVALLSNEHFEKHLTLNMGPALWRAILRAPGFSMSFSKFWVNRAVFLQDAPCQLPQNSAELCILLLWFLLPFQDGIPAFWECLENPKEVVLPQEKS